MCRRISSLQLVTGGDMQISHGVAMARDVIHAAGLSCDRCGILDTDLITAFCNMLLSWCFMVMRKKGLSEDVISRYCNLYDNNYSIVVVTGIQGRCIENKRMSVRQGDKFAMTNFAYGMDPILEYLSTRLKGILIHSQIAQGPVGPPLLHPPPRPEPPQALPGLPPLPPQPPGRQLALRPQMPLVLETRYILYAYYDDLKPAITSLWEFLLVERVMSLFELAFGCKMHRTAISQKCKFLPLGKWRFQFTQNMIPHNFFSLSDHLDFLGVTLKSTFHLTRTINGEALKDRMRKVVGPWRGGRFMSLSLRPHSTNLYAFSKLLYRCNSVHPCILDLKFFNKIAKHFIYADLLIKPNISVLYQNIEHGGLSPTCMKSRAKAAMISSFLETGINPKFNKNNYHNQLF